jgi:hypothetical protein
MEAQTNICQSSNRGATTQPSEKFSNETVPPPKEIRTNDASHKHENTDVKEATLSISEHERKSIPPQMFHTKNAEIDSSNVRDKGQDQPFSTPALHQRQRSLPASQDATDCSLQLEIPGNRVVSTIKSTSSQVNTEEATKSDLRGGHVTVIQLNTTIDESSNVAFTSKTDTKISTIPPNESSTISSNNAINSSQSKPMIPLLPKPPGRDNKTAKIRQHNPILQPTPVISNQMVANNPTIELIRNTQNKNEPGQKTVKLSDNSTDVFKSKSLPRGMPSDFESLSSENSLHSMVAPKSTNTSQQPYNDSYDMGTADTMPSLNPFPAPHTISNNTKPCKRELDIEEKRIEELQLELLRVKFENEELEQYKKELEWRKRSERKEMEELREEMATMQTLYQYRTYSVDSSENSSDEGSDKENVREEAEELTKVLSDLKRENRELEEKRSELCQKIQDERSACIQLRVQIKVEQERIGRKRRGSSYVQ